MVNNDDLLKHIIEIKEDTAGINEHLKNLNGKVIKNVQNIEDNRDKIYKTDLKIARYAGALGVIFVLIQIGINVLF